MRDLKTITKPIGVLKFADFVSVFVFVFVFDPADEMEVFSETSRPGWEPYTSLVKTGEIWFSGFDLSHGKIPRALWNALCIRKQEFLGLTPSQ